METTTLNGKLLMFQKNINAVKKDATNPHFKNKYATLTNILSEVKPVLSDLGLIILQPIVENKVKTLIIDSESKEQIECSLDLPSGLNPQQIGSAITYYRRYLIASVLSLEIEDDDANDASSQNDKAWLNEGTEQFTAAIKFLKEGGTIDKIESKYKLNKKVRESLISQAAA